MVGAAVDVRAPAAPEYRKLFAVRPDNVAPVTVMLFGKPIVIAPVDADTSISLVVPVKDVTPALAIVIEPAPLVTVMPAPCVRAAATGAAPVEPINS